MENQYFYPSAIPRIANGVLREEISGLKKTYCVEDNILVFANIFSDVKFTFDCLV